MTTTFEDYIRVIASPVAWSRTLDKESARESLEILFAVKTKAELCAILDWFANLGCRTDYASYEAHAGGAWQPDANDRYVFRKAAFTIANRAKMKGRALLALDAMRASALVGWGVIAELTSEAEAVKHAAPIVKLALEKHESWIQFSEQLLLGLEFAEGEIDPLLRDAVLGLGSKAHPRWPDANAIPKPTEEEAARTPKESADVAGGKTVSSTAGKITVLALKLSVDCPGCEHALSVGDITGRASCRHCGTSVVLDAKHWRYFFAEDARKRKLGFGGDDPITNDFGDQFFSRRVTTKVSAPACVCGNSLPLERLAVGILTCSCGRSHSVREADARASAIDANVLWVVAPLPKPIDPKATFDCAGCDASSLVGDDPTRVHSCSACKALTFVDDQAFAKSFDPPRRPTFHVVIQG
jgi:Protein of unknown function (DUF1266)